MAPKIKIVRNKKTGKRVVRIGNKSVRVGKKMEKFSNKELIAYLINRLLAKKREAKPKIVARGEPIRHAVDIQDEEDNKVKNVNIYRRALGEPELRTNWLGLSTAVLARRVAGDPQGVRAEVNQPEWNQIISKLHSELSEKQWQALVPYLREQKLLIPIGLKREEKEKEDKKQDEKKAPSTPVKQKIQLKPTVESVINKVTGSQIYTDLKAYQNFVGTGVLSNAKINELSKDAVEGIKYLLTKVKKGTVYEMALKHSQHGSGMPKEGLNTDQIDQLMSRYPEYLGTIPADGIKDLILPKVRPGHKVAFVINTDPSTKKGQHWTAVFIDPVASKSAEYYDSFADPAPPNVMLGIKQIIEKLKPDTYLKYKENKIINQKADTNNCGGFAVKFLVDRLRGQPFQDVSGYSDAMKGEKNLKKFEKEFKPFNYI